MQRRWRGRAWLVLALLAPGCNEICEVGARPPATCVRAALSTSGQGLVVITPECGIVDTDVEVESLFTGQTFTMHVDADGRSPSASLFSVAMDQLVLTWGGDCKSHFCAQVNGPGPARECDGGAEGLPR
jgi:hypothetical protein